MINILLTPLYLIAVPSLLVPFGELSAFPLAPSQHDASFALLHVSSTRHRASFVPFRGAKPLKIGISITISSKPTVIHNDKKQKQM